MKVAKKLKELVPAIDEKVLQIRGASEKIEAEMKAAKGNQVKAALERDLELRTYSEMKKAMDALIACQINAQSPVCTERPKLMGEVRSFRSRDSLSFHIYSPT
jgi:hypothetical protein